MTAISEDAIRELASFHGEGVPVTSCYLNVDGRQHRRHQDLDQEVDALLRSARERANGTASVHHDFDRIQSFVKGGFDRSGVRSIAIFACSPKDLWQVVPLRVPVRNRVVVNDKPAVGQLEAVLEEQAKLGVLLVDRQRTRVFVFELGELVDRSELLDELPRDVDTRGEKERGTPDHHVEALALQHARQAAAVAWAAYQEHGFDRLALGGHADVVREVERHLHPYLRDRLAAHLPVLASAPVPEVLEAVLAAEVAIERAREAELVGRLRDEVGRRRLGVGGLPDVLAALADQRVETLVVSDGYSAEGWRCTSCRNLSAVGRTCKRCGADMESVDDVVEEAVDVALEGRVKVEVCRGNADLDVLGRIGALLRY